MPKILTFLMCLGVAACSAPQDGDKPYVEFIGGGFIFNYRLAEADYGFVAAVKRPLPTDTVLEAEFENPEGDEPIIVQQTAKWGRTSYLFRTPPLQGIKANRDYRVELRLVNSATAEVIARYTKTYRSDVDQDILPKTPPVVGPGYHQPSAHASSKSDPR
jgi:hypothetical protein